MVSKDLEIKTSWEANAEAWLDAVNGNKITSRKLGTNQAIIDTILDSSGEHILDVGCGEGMIARELIEKGCKVTGIDGCLKIVEQARNHQGNYIHLAYEDFISNPNQIDGNFDVIFCNYSLFAEDLVPLFTAFKTKLKPSGRVIIQTVHPFLLSQENYQNKWISEDFAKCGTFPKPMPWYFRTINSWLQTFRNAGLILLDIRETVNPETKQPMSIIWVCNNA
jgi:2-polyprenyl-3-methyl-5-hydroxy-6-metoxy-1,4-benzoquinol methylase